MLGACLAVSLSACVPSPQRSASLAAIAAQKAIDARSVTAVQVQHLDDGLLPGEIVRVSSNARWREGRNDANGASYRYFPDGSGSFYFSGQENSLPEWTLRCRPDAITDLYDCNMYNSGARISAWYGNDNRLDSICVIGHDFPGRVGAIRVSGNQAMRTNTEGCIRGSAARALANQLREGGEVISRRVEWPYDRSRDKQHTVRGFSFAEEMLGFLRYRLSSVSFETVRERRSAAKARSIGYEPPAITR